MLRRPLTIPKRAHPFVKRLYEQMNREDISPREVERRAGIGKMVINEWRTQRHPHITCLAAALEVVGLRLCVREIDYDPTGREIVPVKAKPKNKPVEAAGYEIIC